LDHPDKGTHFVIRILICSAPSKASGPCASGAPEAALKGSGNVAKRIAQVGLTGWANIPSLAVVRIGVLSKKAMGCAVEKILKALDQW
jgi:hypothetical protein